MPSMASPTLALLAMFACCVVFEAHVAWRRARVGEAVDQAQIERLQLLHLRFHYLSQCAMGLCFVFLYRAGERTARQVEQKLQLRAVMPTNTFDRCRQRFEWQAQGAGSGEYLS